MLFNTNAMATFPNDCLPPEGFFKSRQASYKSINLYAKPRGYAFTTKIEMAFFLLSLHAIEAASYLHQSENAKGKQLLG